MAQLFAIQKHHKSQKYNSLRQPDDFYSVSDSIIIMFEIPIPKAHFLWLIQIQESQLKIESYHSTTDY